MSEPRERAMNIMVSTTLACLAVSLLSLSVGYYVGNMSIPSTSLPALTTGKNSEALDAPNAAAAEDSDEEEEGADIDLQAVQAGRFEECKMVLVARTDLGMTKGKMVAQCGHATLACYKALMEANPALVKHWERTGQAKVALRCDSEDALLELQAVSQSLNLCARVIRDAGRTQIASGTLTVIGIGPGPVQLVNQVTGSLKLL